MAPSTRRSSRNNTEALEGYSQNPTESHPPQIQEESAESNTENLSGNSGALPEVGMSRGLGPQTRETILDPGSAPNREQITEESIQALEAEVDRLRRLTEARRLIEELQTENERLQSKSVAKRRRNDRETSTESEIRQKGEIQRHIPIFDHKYTIQKRDSWLSDLEDLFDGAPKKFISDKQKTLCASGYMHADHREKWKQHRKNHPGVDNDWGAFQEWTKTLLDNPHNITTDVLLQIEELSMTPYSDPDLFDAQLARLESHLPPATEEEKARLYYRKIWKGLRDVIITTTNGDLPITRTAMVKQASLLHGVHFKGKKEDPQPHFSNKRRRGNHVDSTSKHSQTDAAQSTVPSTYRGRGNGRGRGSSRGRGQIRGRGRGGRGGGKTPASGVNATSPETKETTTDSTASGSCFICGDKNHWMQDCPSKATI